MLDTAREIPTPEGIELTLRLAGPVVRALAWLLDLFARLGFLIVLSIPIRLLGELGVGLSLILYFAMEWLYPALFEVYAKGATPGKKAFGLAVLHSDGTPVQMPAALIRNLLRAVDFLPLIYGFGLVSMLLSRDFHRIGDIAAGTVVVYRDNAVRHGLIPNAVPAVPPLPLTAAEQRVLLDLAARVPQLTEERAHELAGLVPYLTGNRSDAGALARLLGIANHLIGRRT